ARDERVERPRLVAFRQRPEQRPFAREVVEDRAAREPDLLLEPRDRRPRVAPAAERAPRALQDLALPSLEVLRRDLRHRPILQNRTDVLYSRPMLRDRSIRALLVAQ